MKCPKCNAAVEPGEFGKATAWEGAKAIVRDWRVWAVTVGAQAAAGVLAGGLGMRGGTLGAGASAAAGLFIALRMRTLRKCPRCNEMAHFPVPPTAPAA